MRLKKYQEDALQSFENWWNALKRAEKDARDYAAFQAQQNPNEPPPLASNYPRGAWDKLSQSGELPRLKNTRGEILSPLYVDRTDTRHNPIPHVCLKIPTGGGKTLLGAAAMSRISPPNGLLLWLTPSRAIFRQTWAAFAHRLHPYRQYLERACGGRVKLLKKEDSFTLQDVQTHLCVMPIMLQSSARKNEKDFLKFFRDAGNYLSFFPEPDDIKGSADFLLRYPDLAVNDLTDGAIAGAVKHSLYNVLKIARPFIVLDEAHNAYTSDRHQQLCALNPRLVLELSATPDHKVSNLLVNIPGKDLKQEQMIKLPLNIHAFQQADWKFTLAKAKERRDNLESAAQKAQQDGGRYIRPIMLIRVERVGNDQRDGQHIHADDVRDYLMRELNVAEEHIRKKTAVKDEIADEDLLSEYSAVRYILTKNALQEGWDCSFAYVLTLLDTTSATRALTQMTGRVLRQPYAEVSKMSALNESYIYCFNQDVGEAVNKVKKGLENEGMGDLGDFVRESGGGEVALLTTIKRREQFRNARIFLPQVLHKHGRKYRPLNYESDILAALDWDKITQTKTNIMPGAVDDEMREITVRVDVLGGAGGRIRQQEIETDKTIKNEFFVRRLADVAPNVWLAEKFISSVLASLRKQVESDDELFVRRYNLSETIKHRFADLVENEAQNLFVDKLKKDDIRFELLAKDGFELPQTVKKLIDSDDEPLFRRHGDALEKSLHEKIYAKEFNGLEKDCAIHLDGHDAIKWWHRLAAKSDYALQGWRRNRVYPDFVACVGDGKGAQRRILVLETKGMHLSGNLDTNYKKALLEELEKKSPQALTCGKIFMQGEEELNMSLRIVMDNEWRYEVEQIIGQ